MGEIVAELGAALERAEAGACRGSASSSTRASASRRTPRHSLEALRRLPELAALDRPVLVGPSRKSFIGAVLDLPGGASASWAPRPRWPPACCGGAHVVRVHDVREMVEVVRVCDAIRGDGAGEGRVIPGGLSASSPAPTSRWWDVVDILIVAFIIYELLQFIRGTHAVQMALGGPSCSWSLYWASMLFNLQTVNWLLRTFLPFLGLRHHRGVPGGDPEGARPPRASALPGRRSPAGAQEEVIDEIVLAATTLAAQRTGAIMVIEREMGLRSYIETGIALDAVVTYDLLISIFNPGTPLHDGAVVIQGNRVRGRRLLPAPHREPRARRAPWAAGTAPPSGSPRTPTRWRSWSRRRRA